MKNFITPIFMLLLLQSSLVLHAENKQYNIEIVIFEDTSNRYINSEQWPVILPTEEESKVISPATNRVINNVTHHSSNALAKHVARLNRSSRYNVLLHQSWQQTGLNDIDAISIHVDSAALDNTKKRNNMVMSNSRRQTNSNNKSTVQGALKLILGRYLHIHTDLLYKRFNKAGNQTLSTLNNKVFSEYKIKSQRRMRSRELHYIDHPLLGILVTVVPIEQETEKFE